MRNQTQIMIQNQNALLLPVLVQEYGRRIRDAEPDALKRWVLLAWQEVGGRWRYQHVRDETVLSFARNIFRIDRAELVTFKASMLARRRGDHVVFVRLSSPQKLESWSVPISEPN